MRVKGAELILNPTATAVFNPHHKYHAVHRCTQRALAYANGLFWASCNAANHGGHSVVIAPDGDLITEGPGEQDIVFAELDPSKHSSYDFVSNLRPVLYRPT